MRFDDPVVSNTFLDLVQQISALGGTSLLIIGTIFWLKRIVVTGAELREARAVIAAKDAIIAAKDAQLAEATRALMEDAIPALVKATMIMERQQAELKRRGAR